MRQDATAPRLHRGHRIGRLSRWLALVSATLVVAGTNSAATADTGGSSVSDRFDRTVQSGLGTTSSGDRYRSKASKTTKLSVRNGQGVAKMTSRAAAFQVTAPRVKIADTAVRTSFKMRKLPKSGGVYYGVVARKTGDRYYRATARVGADRRATLTITRFGGRKPARLTRTVALPGRYTSQRKLNLELNVTGSGNVLLQARAWSGGTPAPNWQLTTNDDSSKRLSGRGAPGFSAYLSGKSRSMTVNFDNFTAVRVPVPTHPSPPTPPLPPTPPPTPGIPPAADLEVHEGDLTVTTAGTVVDSLDIRGYLRIKAANVTVKNSIVRGRAGLGNTSMALVQNSSPGLVIQDSEIVAQYPTYYIDGFVGSNATFSRVNIHGVVDSIKIIGDNVVVKDSWLHDNLYYAQVPSGGDTHNDNIQIGVGQNITISNNIMTGTRNAVLMITQDRGHVGNLTFTKNHVDNGACSVNLAEKSYGPLQGLSFTDNVFGTGQLSPRCAIIAPASTAKLLSVANNVFNDGKTVGVSRGD